MEAWEINIDDGGIGNWRLIDKLNSDGLEDGHYIVRIGILASDSDSREWSKKK